MNIHTFGNSNNNGTNSSSCMEMIKSFWDKVPLFSRFIFYTSIIIYILSWFILSAVLFFCNIPMITLNSYHLWTIFTTVFVNLNLLTLLFGLWSWIDISVKLETRGGTMLLMLNFFIQTCLIQILYLTMIVFLSYIFPSVYRQYSAGLWPLIMSLITIECLNNAESDYYFFFTFKAKYYPWILLLFFTILNQFVIQIDVLAGILFGHISFYFIEKYIKVSLQTAESLENCFLFSCLKSFNSNYLI